MFGVDQKGPAIMMIAQRTTVATLLDAGITEDRSGVDMGGSCKLVDVMAAWISPRESAARALAISTLPRAPMEAFDLNRGIPVL